MNDYSRDVLTVDLETFAGQILAIRSRYPLARTSDIVSRIRSGQPVEPTTVTIHFDDCYEDILTNGAPLLSAAGAPACAFISTGFIGTDRVFEHDRTKSPFRFPNLDAAGIRRWLGMGFETAGHTVNHADLGRCGEAEARDEIARCGEELRAVTGQGVELFSYPFGGRGNITEASRRQVREAGYSALFSAYGGHVRHGCDPYDIPRMGASHETPALYCLLMIEGLTPGQLAQGAGLGANA